MDSTVERRRTIRYPVTLSAKINGAEQTYRASVLDISAGGMLLSTPRGLDAEIGCMLDIDAVLIGQFRAQVIDVSKCGLHLAIKETPPHYEQTLGKISRLTRVWS